MSKRVVSLLLTLLLALSVCIPVFATAVEPADRPDVSESAETEETAPEAEEEPSEEEPTEEAPAEEAPAGEEPAEEATEPEEETTEGTENETTEISESSVSPIAEQDGKDYYVVWDGDKTLTFQASKPEDGEENINYWGHTFGEPLSSDSWKEKKGIIETVVFNAPVTLTGVELFKNFTSLKNIELNAEVTVQTTAKDMFSGCISLEEANLSKLSSSGVYYFQNMFSGCISLAKLDISALDTTGASGIYMQDMFKGCNSLEELKVGYNFKIPEQSQEYDIHNEQSTRWYDSHGNLVDDHGSDRWFLEHFADGGKAGTYYWGEHYDYYAVLSQDRTKLTFQKNKPSEDVQYSQYWGCNSTDDGDYNFDHWGWKNNGIDKGITTVEFNDEISISCDSLLSGMTSLNKVTVNGSVTILSASGMFSGCTSLTELDLSNLNISNVTSITDMFKDCTNLKKLIGIQNWDTSKIKYMTDLFSGCSSLTELDISGWNTTQITDGRNINLLFDNCNSLRRLTVGDNFKVPAMAGYGKLISGLKRSEEEGKWIKEGDLSESWADEDFLKHFVAGNQAGTYIWGKIVTLTYDVNGGNGTIENEMYMEGEEVTLNDGKNLSRDGAVFIGWSETDNDDVVTTKNDENASGLLTSPYTIKGDTTVHAVWAVDKNRDGNPDYRESFVDITFDINGGDGSKETAPYNKTYTVSDELSGTSLIMPVYPALKWQKAWEKDGSPATHPALLVGWSKSPIGDIILENDRDSGGAGLTKKDLLVERYEAKVPDTNTTYYAVYAADENGDEMADCFEYSLQVEYYANGGTRKDGRWVDKEKGIFFKCSHHHVPFEDGVVLMDLNQGKAYVERDGATLLGWSDKPVELVTSEANEEAAGIVTEVTMPAKGNKKIYAVWAVDENNNETPDYREQKVTITFNIGEGHGTGTDAEHSTTFTVDLLPGTYFDLPSYAQLHWSEVWEKDGATADFEAILAGWAYNPINDVILEDDIDDESVGTHAHISDGIIKRPHIQVPTVPTTYYAVYAADENNDQIADYLEHAEQVEYYANGGTMVSGSWIEGIEGLFYRCGHHHVEGEEVTLLLVRRGKELVERDGATLIGWSVKPVEQLVTSTAAEEEAGLIETYVMPGGENGKVYAVWAVDENSNGTPDYEESGEKPAPKPTPTIEPEPTPSTAPTPTPTPNPEYGIPDVPWYQYQPEDEGEYVPGPDEVTYSFPDVDPNAWYAGPVGWAAQSGVTAGYPDGNFHPDDTCTRAQIVTFLWKAAGTPMSVGSVSFSDVEQGSFYYDAAVWAANSGIIAGYPDGNFHPDDPCTRAQIVAMLYRYANSPAVTGESKFFDVDAGAYYYNAAIWAEQNGIVAGYPDGGFHPNDACTRAQIVTMLYNYIKG